MKYYIMVFIMLFLNYLPIICYHHAALVQMPLEKANHNLLGDCQVIWKLVRYFKIAVLSVIEFEVVRVSLEVLSCRTTEEYLHAEPGSLAPVNKQNIK